MNESIIAKKILRQAESALSILLGKRVKVNILNHDDVTADRILDAVVKSTGISIERLKSGDLKRDCVEARQLAAYYMSTLLRMRNVKIAKEFNVTGTSITYGLKKVKGYIKIKDMKMLCLIENIESLL